MNKRLDDYLTPYYASKLMMKAAEKKILKSIEELSEVEDLLNSIRRGTKNQNTMEQRNRYRQS